MLGFLEDIVGGLKEVSAVFEDQTVMNHVFKDSAGVAIIGGHIGNK